MSASTLRTLSNDDLVSRLRALVVRERRDTIAILHHLNEVERRGLHVKLGYRSLFVYCTEALGYSESAAGRRVQAARCLRHFPFVEELLERREVSLSSVTAVAGIALKRNEPALFERIRGKTKDEVAAIVAGYRPRRLPRDRVTVVCVKPGPKPAVPVELSLAGGPEEAADARANAAEGNAEGARDEATPDTHHATGHSRGGSAPGADGAVAARGDGRQAGVPRASTTPESEKRAGAPAQPVETKYQVRFTAGADLMRALEEIRSLLSFRLPAGAPMESVLAVVCEEFIERHSPARRRRRREYRTRRPKGAECRADGRGAANPRRIPAAVRDDVIAESGGRCSYVGPGGHRCSATHHLQVDHIRPVALGGNGERNNLRVLCARHNRLEAKRLLGEGVMGRYARRE